MVYAFALPTTSPLSFQTFITSTTHPSLPQSASTARHALRLALKAHKRLPQGPHQDAHLPTVLSALNDYIPYLFAISRGLRAHPAAPYDAHTEIPQASYNVEDPASAGEVVISVCAEFESEWKPTLSASSAIKIRPNPTTSGPVPGRTRAGRISGRGIDFEIAFTLTTLGYVLSRLARACVAETLYAPITPTPEQRTAAIQTATKHLLQASSVHGLLATSPTFTTPTASAVPDLNASTQSALSSLALAEATLLAVLKDDAYVAACIQARNPNDREWMIRAPEIPKVRALLFARLCVRAAEYAEQAAAGMGAVGSGSGKTGRLDEELTRYSGVLGRVSRARACRFFGVDAELAGKIGDGIAWLRAARTPLGLRAVSSSSTTNESGTTPAKGGFSRLKREWTERREERKIDKDAGGTRGSKGSLDPGDDAGRGEEGNVIDMLETKWMKMNDTVSCSPRFSLGSFRFTFRFIKTIKESKRSRWLLTILCR